MSYFLSFARALSFASVLSMVNGANSVQAQPAQSDVCVMGEWAPNTGTIYFQHNKVIMGGYRDLMRTFGVADLYGAPEANVLMENMKILAESDKYIERRLFGVITEPPSYVDLNRSCKKINNPPVSGEYAILFNEISPRVIGEMCDDNPEIVFEISPSRAVSLGTMIEMKEFYDPELISEEPLSYLNLRSRADRNDRLASFIVSLMGVRMAQCQSLPLQMTLKAVREENLIMVSSLFFLEDGIQLIMRDDEIGRRLAGAQVAAQERFQARMARRDNWEEKAAIGAAIAITGLAFMMMSRCNDEGSFGNTLLPDC